MESVGLRTHNDWAKMPVGQIVATCAMTAAVFERYGIDYCCGGRITLADACRAKNVDLNVMEEELLRQFELELPGKNVDWQSRPLAELTAYIIERYHVPLREQLAQIEILTAKVARVHGANYPQMVKVFEIFSIFKTQLEMHMQKEEVVLFPSIGAMEAGRSQTFGCGGGIERPIEVMLQEHDDAGLAMAQFSSLTNRYQAPEDACGSFRVLLDLLRRLETEMHEHVHLENNILFPRALKLKCDTRCS